MNLVSRSLHWGHEIGRISECDDAKGYNLTKGQFYEFKDHLWDETSHDNFVTVIDDSDNEITVPIECFYLANSDEKVA